MRPERFAFVGRAQDHLGIPGANRQDGLCLVFPGDQRAVRKALKKAMVFLRNLDITIDDCGPIELVLAEVINNVVEHAYAGRARGIIELCITRSDEFVSFEVLDDGFPMPDDQAPRGEARDIACEPDVLPEGGFGWFLIRELTHDLTYSRDGNRNRLVFNMIPGQITPTH